MWPPSLSDPPGVPRDLSPEERRRLEAFIRWADESAASLSPTVRGHLERDRRIAELFLRATGPDGTEDDWRALAELRGVPLPWSWVERKPGVGYRKWTDDRLPRNTEERRHKGQKDFGVKAVRGWIGHPAVAREVEAARPVLKALVAPLLMPDQGIVTFVTAHFLGCASVYPDGTEGPDPFIGAPPDVIDLAEQIEPAFVTQLRQLADRIEAAGAPLDPSDPAVLLVLSQLSLLGIELGRPPAEIAADLNIWPPGSIDRDAAVRGQVAVHASRHGRTVRFQADLAAGAEMVARRLGPPAIRGPYAGGGKRATRRDTRRLRDALARLVEQYPTLTAGSLLDLVSRDVPSALEQLRTALGENEDWLPDQRRLERNWPKSRQ